MAVDFEEFRDGIRITRLSSTEREIRVPEEVQGRRVLSLGPGFLRGSPGSGGRTVSIPSTVVDMDPEALSGLVGLVGIEYDGDMEDFSSFGVVIDHDCDLRCTWQGRPYSFRFTSNSKMSFPEFDDEILNSMFKMSPEIAVARISAPVLLSDVHRERYSRYLSERIMPKAEQAVVNGDAATLEELHSTGLLDRETLRSLLERSLRSGKTPMTSVIMSLIRKDSQK